MTPELTNLGKQTLLKTIANKAELVFSSMSIGDGIQQDPLTAVALKNAKISKIPFTNIKAGKNFVTLSASVSNENITSGFRISEIGFFVKDPNNTDKEILYAIGSEAYSTADYVPAKTERLVDLQFDVSMYIGTAENISATLAEAIGYNPGVGKSLAGEMVAPGEESVTAGDGAEIFNDYRERTKDGLSRVGNVASGNYSHAEGEGTTASGEHSHSEGLMTNAEGNNSHAEGGAALASGTAAHAEGMMTNANGTGSHAEGGLTRAKGVYSHAENEQTTALGDFSHSEGESSKPAKSDYTSETNNDTVISDWDTSKFSFAKGKASHVEGCDSLALGEASHAENKQTVASGDSSHAEGSETVAGGDSSHAEGMQTSAAGDYTHAEGAATGASGYGSHAEGGGTVAAGAYSHAENGQTVALGDYSHAEGESYNNADSDYTYNTPLDTIISAWNTNPFSLARGKAAHCEGTNTLALGDRSHAEGIYTIARGVDSHAGGYKTIAKDIQFVTGKSNTPCDGCITGNKVDAETQSASNTLFIVGNGTSAATSNAFRVSADGQCYGLKSFAAQGADFAEYFEWCDGNPENEDRRGKFVTLDGEKIKLANDGDYILGIVTGSGAFIGNGQSENWQGKYLKDVFGDLITQSVEIPETTDEKTGAVVPAHTVTQYAVNPDYDPATNYVAREFRKEWSPVGMLGQVTLVDDGTCKVNGYCKPSSNGIGTASDIGYRVLKRLDNNHVKVLVK